MTVPDSVVQGLAASFQIRRELGRGATAVALLATPREPAGAAPVVVKILLRAIDDAPLLSRFRRELAALSRLDHPGVVRLLGGGEAAGHPYLVSEYHEGVRSLEEVVAGGPLAPARAAVLAAGVADALAACHGAGFVHRDVKPANILLRPDDRPLLIDFGLVAGELLGETRTATGVILGTPAYMAPELLRGLPASPASDRYALGCVLVELLTGRPAFEGELGAYLASKTRPYPPARLRGLSRGLGALSASLLDPDPAARPGEEVGARLRELATAPLRPAGVTQERGASRALQARGMVPPAAMQPPERRRSSRLAMAAGLMALVATGLVMGRLGAPASSPALERLSFEELGKLGDDSALAEFSLPPSCPLSIRGRLYLARHHLDAGRGGPALDLLLPLVREGLPEASGKARPLLGLMVTAAASAGPGATVRLTDEVLAGLQRAVAGTPAREALEGYLAALDPDELLRAVLRRPEEPGNVEMLVSSMGERAPVVGSGQGLPGPVRATVAAWGRALAAPTAAERSAALVELRSLDGGAGRLPVRRLRASAVPFLVRSASDLPSLEALLDLVSRFRQADERFGEGTRKDLDRYALEAAAIRAGLRSRDGVLGVEEAREVWAWARDEDFGDALGMVRFLGAEKGARWLLAPAWLGLGRADRAWLLFRPLLEAPFALPPLAEELCRVAGILAGEPDVGPAVRERLRALRDAELHPERRAFLALALLASHRPVVAPSARIPSDPALEEAGRQAASDPALADLSGIVALPPLVLGTLAWAAGPVLGHGGPIDRVLEAVGRVLPLVPSLEGFSLEERWVLLLHGRGERRYAVSSPFAPLVGGATREPSPEARFLAVTCLLRDRRRFPEWVEAVPALDADVSDRRQAVVDAGLVDYPFLGSLGGLVEVEPRRSERVALVGRLLSMLVRRWPEPSPFRSLALARVLRTADDVVQEEETALRDGALASAALVVGRRVEDLMTEAYERILASSDGELTPEVTLWAAQWFVSRGQGARAEEVLRTVEPDRLPRYLRWRWHLNMATAVSQLPGRAEEARAHLDSARSLPWAVEDLIRNEMVRVLTVRPLQRTDGPRER